MRCPTCGRDTPDALMVCRHCGASTRPSLLQRLFGWLHRPRASASPVGDRAVFTADEEPMGIEMPALGVKSMSVTVNQMQTTGGGDLPLDASAGGGEVRYERIETDDGGGRVTVTERGTPLDPQLAAAIDKLMKAEAGTTERQIVVDVNGERQSYGSADELPPEVRKMLGRFADAPVLPEGDAR